MATELSSMTTYKKNNDKITTKGKFHQCILRLLIAFFYSHREKIEENWEFTITHQVKVPKKEGIKPGIKKRECKRRMKTETFKKIWEEGKRMEWTQWIYSLSDVSLNIGPTNKGALYAENLGTILKGWISILQLVVCGDRRMKKKRKGENQKVRVGMV